MPRKHSNDMKYHPLKNSDKNEKIEESRSGMRCHQLCPPALSNLSLKGMLLSCLLLMRRDEMH